MSTEANKALIRRFYELLNGKQDIDAIVEIWDAYPTWHGAGIGEVHGLESFKQLAALFSTAFPDLQDNIVDLIAEGDRVAARLIARGTHKGTFMGIPATGKPFTISSITFFRIADGKIAEEWDETDYLGLLQQLEVVPPVGLIQGQLLE